MVPNTGYVYLYTRVAVLNMTIAIQIITGRYLII